MAPVKPSQASVTELLESAERAFESGDDHAAIEFCNRVLTQKPGFPAGAEPARARRDAAARRPSARSAAAGREADGARGADLRQGDARPRARHRSRRRRAFGRSRKSSRRRSRRARRARARASASAIEQLKPPPPQHRHCHRRPPPPPPPAIDLDSDAVTRPLIRDPIGRPPTPASARVPTATPRRHAAAQPEPAPPPPASPPTTAARCSFGRPRGAPKLQPPAGGAFGAFVRRSHLRRRRLAGRRPGRRCTTPSRTSPFRYRHDRCSTAPIPIPRGRRESAFAPRARPSPPATSDAGAACRAGAATVGCGHACDQAAVVGPPLPAHSEARNRTDRGARRYRRAVCDSGPPHRPPRRQRAASTTAGERCAAEASPPPAPLQPSRRRGFRCRRRDRRIGSASPSSAGSIAVLVLAVVAILMRTRRQTIRRRRRSSHRRLDTDRRRQRPRRRRFRRRRRAGNAARSTAGPEQPAA